MSGIGAPKSLQTAVPRSNEARALKNRVFLILCVVSAFTALVILAILLISILIQGLGSLSTNFLTNFPSRNAEEAGMKSALWGSIYICIVCAATALPIGVGTAVLLEEFQPRHPIARFFHFFLNLNITNLAGVPSIVYGILGLTLFVFVSLPLVGQVFGKAGDPGISFGATYYDQFTDATDKQSFRVEVDSRTADPTPLTDGLAMYGTDGKKVSARVMEWDGIEELQNPVWDKVDAFEEELNEKYADLSDSERYDKISAETRELEERLMAESLTAVFPPDREAIRASEKHFYYFQLPFGRGVLAGGLTLMLVILPIIITAAVEAIRAVPDSLREGALACGATKWQMVWNMTLPAAVPGIMTGSILAISRAIGEAAPILIIAGGLVFVPFTPKNLMDDFTAMPLQIYNWAGRPQVEFHHVAAAGIIVLLSILLTFNAVAVFIRQKYQKPLS